MSDVVTQSIIGALRISYERIGELTPGKSPEEDKLIQDHEKIISQLEPVLGTMGIDINTIRPSSEYSI